MLHRLLLTTAFIMPLPAFAQDVALLLGNQRYEQLDNVTRGEAMLAAAPRFEALGFEVFSRANARALAAKDLAAAFQAGAGDADRLVVALAGHFVTDGARTWFLTAEASAPDLFSVDGVGVSLDSLLQVLAARPGQAVLVLGMADVRDLDMAGSALRAGIGALDVPQGVTVIRTDPGTAATVMQGPLSAPEAVIGALLADNPALEIDGFLPRDWAIMPGEVIVETPALVIGPTPADLNAEATLWDSTTAADTVEAYRAYVARYPQGRFVVEAETQIAAILAEPNRAARLAEDALNLSRDVRRTVQANLTALTYDTRGVDGLFGPVSRGAITNWQQSNGFPQTSYLTRDQLNLLDAQAARRQAEIDAEAARAVAQAEALDRAYWAETGGVGDEPGFRAYLARYPNGVFAAIATARLAAIDAQRQTQAEAADRAAWSNAQSGDVIAGYQDYLVAYPDGVFAAQARARIDALSVPQISDAQVAGAQEEEATLRLSGIRAQLLELRLRDLGHNPGRLDGVIDGDTRNAIVSYQEEQGVLATGYVDRATAVGLITGSISVTIPTR